MVKSDTEGGDARASQRTHECPRQLPDDPLREPAARVHVRTAPIRRDTV